jgi:hypothetical protein
MEQSRRAACIPRSYKGQDGAREHGINGRQKLLIILDKTCFGYLSLGFLNFCFIIAFFINQLAGGSLWIVIVVFTSFLAFWGLEFFLLTSLHARQISIYPSIFAQ